MPTIDKSAAAATTKKTTATAKTTKTTKQAASKSKTSKTAKAAGKEPAAVSGTFRFPAFFFKRGRTGFFQAPHIFFVAALLEKPRKDQEPACQRDKSG